MEPGSMHLHYIEQTYEDLRSLGGESEFNTILCRNRETGQLVVKKQVSLEQGVVYHQLKKMQHPNLIQIYDVCDTGAFCLVVMEFISGKTMEACLEEKGYFPLAQAMQYLEQILNALQIVHSQNIIHRDIKPANILISSDNVIKLIDFGIARVPKERQKSDTRILGTAGYAAPEQFGFQQTDIYSDIYAVGVLMNKMLTGKMPNEGVPVDERLRKIILKCIHIDPENRYGSVGELKQALGISHGFKRLKVTRNTLDKSIWPGFRRGVMWRKIVACLGYGFLILCSLGLFFLITESQTAFDVLDNLYLIICLWLGFFIVSNFLRWDRKFPGIKEFPKPLRIFTRIVMGYLLFHFWAMIFV